SMITLFLPARNQMLGARGSVSDMKRYEGHCVRGSIRRTLSHYSTINLSFGKQGAVENAMKDIKRVAIIGAGTMGRRIAFGCLLGNMNTCLFDNVPGVCEQAVKAVHTLIKERVTTQKVSSAVLESADRLLSYTSSLSSCVNGADLIIETVPENVELKRRVFSDIDA